MKVTNTLEREGDSENRNRFALWFMAPIATINVLLAVLLRWSSFDLTAKFLAVALCVSLLFVPAMAVWGERAGRKKIGRFEVATVAYMYLMIATMLFARH